MSLYEKAGRKKEIQALKENLKNAIVQNLSIIDFNTSRIPTREQKIFRDLIFLSPLQGYEKQPLDSSKKSYKMPLKQYSLDLNDPSFQQELRKMQEKNLEDVRNWRKIH